MRLEQYECRNTFVLRQCLTDTSAAFFAAALPSTVFSLAFTTCDPYQCPRQATCILAGQADRCPSPPWVRPRRARAHECHRSWVFGSLRHFRFLPLPPLLASCCSRALRELLAPPFLAALPGLLRLKRSLAFLTR